MLATVQALRSSADHKRRVQAVVDQVREKPEGKFVTVSKNTRSHVPHDRKFKASCHEVDVSELDSIIKIDAERLVAVVEGQVNMGQLCEATLRHGLVPAVVPEFRSFTVAGLTNGLGIQSSSHRFGLFPDTLEAFEVVLGDGAVVIASPHDPDTADLFYHLPGSYGSMGFVTAAGVRLVKAGPWVISSYRWFSDAAAYEREMKKALGLDLVDRSANSAGAIRTGSPYLYVEGFAFGPKSYVLVTANYSSTPENKPLWIANERGQEYYHHHALNAAKRGYREGKAKANPSKGWLSSLASSLPFSSSTEGEGHAFEDAMTAEDYLFRLQRGYWWLLEHIVGLPPVTDSKEGRALLDDAVRAEVSKIPVRFSWAGQSANPNWTTKDMHRVMVNQDMGVRFSRLLEATGWVQKNLDITPLWHCPMRINIPRGCLWNYGWNRVADGSAVGLPGLLEDTLTATLSSSLEQSPLEEAGYSREKNPEVFSRFPMMAVDIGCYGEPMASGFTARRTLRELQKMVCVPSFWGGSYLLESELSVAYDFKTYEGLRSKYKAEGTFLDMRKKTSFFDPSQPELPKIPLWRLHRAGLYEPVMNTLKGIGAVTAAGTAVLLATKTEKGREVVKAATETIKEAVGRR
jgi:FAD binding domain